MAKKKKFWNWRELIGLGALAYLGSELEKATEKSEELEAENEELEVKNEKLEMLAEKLGIDVNDLDDIDWNNDDE